MRISAGLGVFLEDLVVEGPATEFLREEAAEEVGEGNLPSLR